MARRLNRSIKTDNETGYLNNIKKWVQIWKLNTYYYGFMTIKLEGWHTTQFICLKVTLSWRYMITLVFVIVVIPWFKSLNYFLAYFQIILILMIILFCLVYPFVIFVTIIKIPIFPICNYFELLFRTTYFYLPLNI